MTFEPPETFNISEYFLGDRIAEGNADRRAVLTDAGELTYGDVNELANRYGNALVYAGLRPEERVIIALPDGADWVGAFFGILRAGGVVVMVNPDLQADQIRYFYDYTRARLALIHTGTAPAFRAAADGASWVPDLLEVGTGPGDAASVGGGGGLGPDAGADAGAADATEFDAAVQSASAELEPFPSHRDDAAIWLFSGGTTGNPKAVVQPHRSFANTTELYGKAVLGMGPEDITLSVPKLFFGYATGTNLLFPFSVGATTALFPERCTAETMFEKIAAFRPTVLINVPTLISKMLASDAAAGQDLSCLRLSTSAGEALPVELHGRWDEMYGTPLLDGLGTAEMWHVFVSNRPDDVKPGTIGRAVDGFDVRVRDEEGHDLRAGQVGYLWVNGDSRALGYWQQLDKTRDAFRGEWYVSGDMIEIDADGYVTYCGRADDMLKVSGKWLSPKELENCLLAHDAVKEVAVVGVSTEEGLVKPSAFVILTDGNEASDELAGELQAWTKDRLEPYKYPRAVVFMDDLPRTHLGKVDRGALARR